MKQVDVDVYTDRDPWARLLQFRPILTVSLRSDRL